jgi:YD repeat-containing protein
MVAIVSGNSLGLNLTSPSTLGQQGLAGTAGHGRNGQGAYVNIANGNLILQDQDDYLAARGLDAAAVRTYNSQGLFNDDNGDNWSNGAFVQPLQLTGALNSAGSTIRRTDRDGSAATYAYDAARSLYVSTEGEGAHDTIAFIAGDNQFEWRDGSSGVTQRYEGAGLYRLLSSRDSSGNALTYGYNASGYLASVASASGETTFYDYSGANLTQVRTVTTGGATSTRTRYGYDGSNRLTSVTVDLTPGDNSIADGKAYQTNYTYDGASKRLASVTQSDGTSLAITYVDVGGTYKVATIKDALNQTTSFTYNFAAGAAGYTTVTDPQGLVTRYDADASGRLTKITAPTVSGTTPSRQFAYNASGDVVSVTDGEGRVVSFEYDANGNQVLQRDHAGNTVTRTYDARNQLLTETLYVQPDPDGAGAGQPGTPLTTRYVYDAGNRNLLRFVISPEGRMTEHRYNGFGERIVSVTYAGGQYPTAGLPAGAAPSEAEVVAWAGAQNLAATQRVDAAFDARGQVQSRMSYAKVDASGLGVADGTQSLEQYVYDQAGRLLQTVSATNGTTTYTYDGLGRILSSTNALGHVSLTQYQDAARKTVVTLASGLVTTSTYDAAGQLVSVLQSDAAAAALGETKYFYDASGRLRMTQDPTGVRNWMLYDEAGRKTADIDGNGSMTEYMYNGNGLLTCSISWGNAVDTSLLVDASGLPVTNLAATALRPAGSSADFATWRAYDPANRLVKVAQSTGTGATAAVTETRYDGASHVVEVVRYATIVSADGGVGSVGPGTVPVPAASPADRSTRNFYDANGILAGTLDAEGYLTAYIYDAAGRLTQRVGYATATDSALRPTGTLAQLTPAASGGDIRSFILYDGKSQAIAEVDGEGYLTETVYDAGGNVTQTVRYAARVTAAVTASSSVADIRPAFSAADRTTSRVYDALNRITQETSPEGTVTSFAYDNVGNLVSTTRAAGTTEVRAIVARYDLQGRLIGELTAEGAALLTGGQTQAQIDAIWAQHGTFHAYDAAGRRVSTTAPSGARYFFYYNADGALTHTVNALGEVRENRHDHLGRVTEEHVYANRIGTAGLTGGLVTTSLTNAIAAVAMSTDLRVRYTYTRDSKVYTSWDGQGNYTHHSYNVFGDEIQTDEDLGGGLSLSQTYAFDRRGLRTGAVVDPYNNHGLNAITTTTYDAFGRVIRTVDPNGKLREQSFDKLGRVVTTRDPLNALRSSSYDAFGRILTQTDALGNVTSFAYNAAARSVTMTTAEGIVTTTTYNRHGQLHTVADGKGQVTSYSYDRNGELLQTTTPLTTTSSSYDAMGRLMEATDANGKKVAYTYDAANRVLTRRVDSAGLNLTTTYAYDGKGQKVSVTDANGIVTTTQFDNKGQVVRQTVDPAGLNLQTAYTYNARGNVLTVTAPAGTVTQYVYDALGRRTQEKVDPTGLNLQRSWSYDKNGNAVSSTDPLGNVTRYAYDDAGRLTFTLDPLGNLRQTSYDAEGRIVKTVAYATPISMAGLPASPAPADIQPRIISQAAQDVLEHRVYDKDGRTAATVDGTGAVTRYTYDANGNLVSRVGYATRINLASWTAGTLPAPVADAARDSRLVTVYNALNQAVYLMDGIGAVVAQIYDGNGNVLQRTAYATAIPTNTTTTQAAIASAVAAVANSARDASVRNTYDAAGRLTWSADGTGAVTQRVYDKNGNVVRHVAYATAVTSGASPSTVPISAADRATSMAYDAANRLVLQVDAMRAVTEQVYGANGNVVRRIAYANAIAAVPALGTPGTAAAIRSAITADAAADRSTRYGYDAAGRQSLAIDALGAVTGTEYDAAGHAIAVTAYANAVNASGLAAVPTLAAMTALVAVNAGSDRVTKYAYDAAGQRVYEVDPLGTVKYTQYDGTGRVTRRTRYLLSIPAATANAAAAVAAAIAPNAANDQVDIYSYNAAGQLIATADALGGTESYTYDALGRKLTFTNKKGSIWTYTYDAAGRMLTESTPQVSLTTVSSNESGVLVAGSTVNAGIVTQMAYDALGNLTQRTEAFGRSEERTTRYEYDAAGRQVRVIYPPVGVYNAAADPLTANGATGVAVRVEATQALETQTFYDALGNAVANRDVGGSVSQKTYDQMGRVVHEIDALGFVTAYGRNGFGDVIQLTRLGSATNLANREITQASHAASKSEVEAAYNAAGFDRSNDRYLLTSYDRAGRVVEATEQVAYVYDSSAAAGLQSGTAGKKTRNTYDAFGQLVQVKTLRNAADTWSTTTHYYDKAGNQTATLDALNYLTRRSFDNMGNLTEVREYSNAVTGTWNLTSYTAPAAHADDRVVQYEYDRLNRKTTETRVSVEFSTAANGTSARGNLSTTFGYDAVGNQTRVTDADGKSTYTYCDAVGRIAAVAAPTRNSTADGASLTPLTVFRRDAYGNVVVKVEYANGAASASGSTYTAGAASGSDRTMLAAYDSLGRNSHSTDANGASQYVSYDAYGHAAKKWQGVTGLDGITRTLFEVNVYDKLGQLVETRTPASTTVHQGGLTAAYTARTTDEGGAVLTPNKMVLGWSSLVDPQGGTVHVQVEYMASSTLVLDENGNPVSGEPAHMASVAQDFSAAAASGGAQVTWTAGTDGVAYLRVMQLSGGQWIAKWEGTPVQASGSGIVTVTQEQAGVVRTSLEYNAFGEVTRKGAQGGRQEYFDYDAAGRLWRTNSGDGIDRINLFDAQGNVTAEIRSSGSGRDNADIKGFVNAQAADANPYTRRVDVKYDALGRVTAKTEAMRQELQGGLAVQRQYTTASVTQSATPVWGESGYILAGINQVTLAWNSLSALGSGDIKVVIEYRTAVITTGGGYDENNNPLPVTYTGGTARSYASGIFNGDAQAGGVTLAWQEPLNSTDGGISKVTRLVVYKKDISGNWQAVIDQTPGYGANEITVAAPSNPGAAMTLELRPAGSSGDTGWFSVSLADFGNGYRFDARSLALGSYEYRVKVTVPGEATRTTGTGTVSITQPPLNSITTPITYGQAGAGVLAWQTPGASVEQVLRYRVSGSTGAWSTLAVAPRNNGAYDGVDTSALAAGTYQFELLWTQSGQGVPGSHAAGTFTVVAAIPPYWVPPVNLPHVSGLSIGTTVVGGTLIGYDEAGVPLYSGGTTVKALSWTAANATVARYRVSGGGWNYLAIDNSGEFAGESGLTGVQKAAINGIAPGTYQVEILVGSPPTAQATGNLVVYAQNPGYYQTVYVQVPTYHPVIAYYAPVYETRYATRDVPYQVWVADPPYIIGYDENYQPIYAYPGHYETRYYQETYSYQVQVGQTPVYATDENGNIVYQTVWVTQAQQVWVEGTTPTPTVSVTTPPYTPGYTVPGTPAQYSVSVTTSPSSVALSTTEGGVMSQSAGVNSDDRWLRPTVLQTTDRWGNLTEITDPRSAYWKTTYRFNANNQLVQQTQPDASGAASADSPVSSVYYDKLGRQIAVKDANGFVNGQLYDAGGNLIEEQHADGGVVTHRYDAFGQKVKTTDAMGNVVTFTYDKMGHMLAMAKGQAGVYRVNGANAREDLGVRQIVESWTYDQLGQKLTQTNGNSESLSYVYDLRGNVVETRQPLGQAVRAAFDAQGRKAAQADANGYASTWTYDYFGLLTSHSDLGGARYSYSYDNARQLVAQSSTRGQSITYGYDAAGQVTSITDWANGKATTYMYDLSGRRIRERVVQGGVTYQDNHLAYDAQGNLRDVADARAHIVMEYDKVGNRTRVASFVNYQGISGETSSSIDRYFKYDAMNRQIVVDGVDAAGNIGTQGHQITYDRNGNRTSDTSWGNKVATAGGQQVIAGYNEDGSAIYYNTPVTYVASQGLSTETYRYDALNRLQGVVRDGVQIDVRYYDGADRVVQSGPAGNLPTQYADIINQGVAPGEMNGKETRINRYDANGRLLHQKTLKSDNSAKADISWDPNESFNAGGTAYGPDGYDAAGNTRGYVMQNHEAGKTMEYTIALNRFEGYQAGVTSGVGTGLNPGSTTQSYDANGFMVGVTDASLSSNNRTFVNDSNGVALFVNQGDNVQRQLVVNGEVLGIYGAAPNPTSTNNSFANLVDFDFGYARISANYPNPSPGAYQVRSGDTLQSIAQGAYGDSLLWYRIAEANGLASSSDLKVGQTLNIPNRVSTISNNNATFKPYDPTRIEGDMTPHLATPSDKGCGGVGKLLMVIIVVVVTIMTAGAGAVLASGGTLATATASQLAVAGMGAMSGTFGVGVAALAGAAGSLAGQVFAVAAGMQQKINWKGVAVSAVSAGVSVGVGQFASGALSGTGFGAAVGRAALGNVITQGIGVATGLQKKFDWKGVAASAVGSAAGYGMSEALGITSGGVKTEAFGRASFGEQLFESTLAGFTAGATAAVLQGGKVSVQQVATDAFGNALGSSIAEGSSSAGSFSGEGSARSPYVDGNGDHMVFGAGRPQGDAGPFIDAFSRDYGGDRYPGVDVADAGSALRLSNGSSPDDEAYYGNIINTLQARDAQRQAAGANYRAGEAQATSNLYANGAGDVRETTPMASGGDSWYPHDGGGTLVGRRMTPAEEAAFDAENGLSPSSGTGSIKEIGPVEGSFTFDPLGRGLKGVGGVALDAWLALPRAAVGVGNLARDAWGYAANAVAPQRSVLTGQPFDYQPRSGLIQSLQQNGVAGTVGMGIAGAVRNAPGIGLIGALGAPSRDWGNVGAQVFSTGAAAAGVSLSGVRGVAGSRALPYQSMDEVLLEVNRNADIATELARRAYARGVITGSPQAFGTRAHSIFEGLNERLNRRLIGENAPFRIAVEEFRDPAGIVTGRRAAGSIGADARVFDAQTGASLRVLDLKTHGGVQIPIGTSRQQDFINRFGLPAEEMYRLR